MYKQLITYNLSNVDTRESFEEMIEDMGFDRPDGQTAYTLRARSDVSVREMKSEIVNWSECVGSYIDVEDRVDLYYVTVENLERRLNYLRRCLMIGIFSHNNAKLMVRDRVIHIKTSDLIEFS